MTENILEQQWSEATIQNNFVFGRTMELFPELCRQLIEIILKIKVSKIDFPEREKVIENRSDSKGIRIDVYVADNQNRSFDLEMQIADTDNISKRMRYYQGLIDLDKLKHGQHYSSLGDSFIIFICPFDKFKEDRHIYTFKNFCVQDSRLELKDGATKILLNTKGKLNDVSPDLKKFLDYVDRGIVSGDFVSELDDAVREVKTNKKARLDFMTYHMALLESKLEGENRGIKKGVLIQAEKTALNMLADVDPIDKIIKFTNLSIDHIKELAKKFCTEKKRMTYLLSKTPLFSFSTIYMLFLASMLTLIQ